MGRNGSNVDTLMFANVNSTTRKVTLISIPRDLYVDGRKINSVYADFGVREQVRWVENVLGYRIHKYILIDMLVFRDIIDLMGGVTVVLEEDLIDPTYRTCDGDVCSTLYYEAGEHHLNGVEALRVARSRYTTSDYSRAARQQLILEGVKDKAQTFGLGDAGTLVSLVKSVLAATNTDINLDEAIRYYFRYQNFDLNRGYVLSTNNVLEAIPVPVNFETSRIVTLCLDENDPATCEDSYAIDTLGPRDGDWDVIRWYVQSLL